MPFPKVYLFCDFSFFRKTSIQVDNNQIEIQKISNIFSCDIKLDIRDTALSFLEAFLHIF